MRFFMVRSVCVVYWQVPTQWTGQAEQVQVWQFFGPKFPKMEGRLWTKQGPLAFLVSQVGSSDNLVRDCW